MFILFLSCHFHTYYVQTVCADSNCSVTVRVGCGLISQVIDDVLDERRVRIGLAIFVHTDSIRIALAERQRIHLGNDLDWHIINAARLYIRAPVVNVPFDRVGRLHRVRHFRKRSLMHLAGAIFREEAIVKESHRYTQLICRNDRNMIFITYSFHIHRAEILIISFHRLYTGRIVRVVCRSFPKGKGFLVKTVCDKHAVGRHGRASRANRQSSRAK